MNTLDETPAPQLTPAQRPSRRPRTPLGVLLRLLAAAVLAAALVSVAAAGMTVTSAPRWVSLTIEPFSLLLLPGAVYAELDAAIHMLDFSTATVVQVSFVFYFAVFALWLLRRMRS